MSGAVYVICVDVGGISDCGVHIEVDFTIVGNNAERMRNGGWGGRGGFFMVAVMGVTHSYFY